MKSKKKIIILSAIILSAVAITAALVKILTFEKVDLSQKKENIFFFEADYGINVKDDLVYQGYEKRIRFTKYGVTVFIDENSAPIGVEKLFYDYFQTVINGRYGEYKEYFAKEFFKHYAIPEKFTPQKIYDIEVDLHSSDVNDGKAVETYVVRYKIRQNTGTLRGDVGSDDVVPILFNVTAENGEHKISGIFPLL